MSIKVFIVEDHKLISDAWCVLLGEENEIEVVGQTGEYNKILNFVEELRPDIVLMDNNIIGGSGVDVTLEISNKLAKTRVIGLSIHDDMAYVKKFFTNGAKGYLTKNTSKEELIFAIKEVFKGVNYVCQEIKDRQFFNSIEKNDIDTVKELTSKEIEIIKLISIGLTSAQIADKLFVSKRTVDVHRYNILKKLNFQNSAQLSSWAIQKGYI